MASKFVVPLELPNLYGTPSSIADEGFVVCYIKDGWWTKKSPAGTESDLVLDRTLTGLSQLESTDQITQYDTVKTALEKLQHSILTLELTGGIQGNGFYSGGKFIMQTTIPNISNYTCEDVAACEVITNIQQDITDLQTSIDGLATVASTGSYDDLTDLPSLSEVATSGSYNDLSDTPPAVDPQIQSDWTQSNTAALDFIKNKPQLFSGSYDDLTDAPTLATVATSGSYDDLTDKPTIPTLQLTAPELTGRSDSYGNEYQVGDVVFSGGNIYRCLAQNSGIPVTDPVYWELIAPGYKIRQQAVDWNASSGDYQVLNKPSVFPPETHSHSISDITDLSTELSTLNTYIGTVESSVPIYTTDLDDVSTAQPTDGQILKFNSTTSLYEPTDLTVAASLDELTDVSTAGAAAGDALVYDGTSWVADQVSGLPAGGTQGQILAKQSATDGDATWIDNYADWTSVVKHVVKNDGTAVIPKGTPVYVTGANGTNILVRAASNASEATSSKTMGLLQSQLDTNGNTQTGFVITEGLLGGLNTQGQTAGDPVWLGTNGDLIYGLANKPSAPNHLVFIGIVTKVSAASGEIFVKVQNGFEVRELHDVSAASPSNNDVLRYNSSNHLWEAAPIIVPAGMTWMGAFPG
jgi:hypothetical protein